MTSLGVARQQSPQTHLSSFTPPTIWTSGLTRRSAATSSQCSPGRDLGDGGSNSARGRCPCFPPLCAGRVDDVALRITAAGQRCAGAGGSDDRGGCRDPHDLRGGAAPGRHEGGRRGVTARPNVGARTDAPGMVDGAADVDVAAASLTGWSTSTPGWSWQRLGR